jgi:glutamyl-tRNA synthetase
MVKVRFAPSPTGNLHIGGARTALFNWLYARAKKGKFILRIEDTDKERSKKEFVDEILGSLEWLGFYWDEVYYQSQRQELYLECARRLVKEGKAYTDTSLGRGEAIIYKVLPKPLKVQDLIRGEIAFDTAVIKDQVLIKSDGTPTYNFACVVDDAMMQITHVIRGDDHLSNTPKQVLIYDALGFNVPHFAHLPLIMGAEGGRLSKRTGATAISDYRNMGYLAEALVNYLLLLSWSPGDDREVIDINEAIKLFEIKDVNKTSAAFDQKKLSWINNYYIKHEDPQKLAERLIPLLVEKKYIPEEGFNREYLTSAIKLFQERLPTLNDFPVRADYFFVDEIAIEPQAREKFLSRNFSKEFKLFIERLDGLKQFDAAHIEAAFRELVGELNLQAKELIHPMRVALTGKTVGPGLFDLIYCLGKERVKKRLSRWINAVK